MLLTLLTVHWGLRSTADSSYHSSHSDTHRVHRQPLGLQPHQPPQSLTILLCLPFLIPIPHAPAAPTMPEIIYESDHPSPDVLPECSLFDYLFHGEANVSPLKKYDPRLPAYIDGLDGRVITRGGLEFSSLRLVTGLRNLGIGRNDVACVWGLNSLEWVRTTYGCMAAGVTVSPANYA